MATPNEIKSILFSILENAFDKNSDVTATQQMGVQLSNAIKKEGVVIIQNQNLEVYSQIFPKVIKAIRMCDELDEEPEVHMLSPEMKSVKALPEPEPEKLKEIELPNETSAVNAVCEYFFVNGVTWKGMANIMKAAYLKFILSKFDTQTEAAKFLDIGPSYLSNMIIKGKEKDHGK